MPKMSRQEAKRQAEAAEKRAEQTKKLFHKLG